MQAIYRQINKDTNAQRHKEKIVSLLQTLYYSPTEEQYDTTVQKVLDEIFEISPNLVEYLNRTWFGKNALFPKNIWAPFCIADLEIRNERTNNILERCWNDMKQVIHGVLGPLQLIEKLQAYDETKIKDFERRIVEKSQNTLNVENYTNQKNERSDTQQQPKQRQANLTAIARKSHEIKNRRTSRSLAKKQISSQTSHDISFSSNEQSTSIGRICTKEESLISIEIVCELKQEPFSTKNQIIPKTDEMYSCGVSEMNWNQFCFQMQQLRFNQQCCCIPG